MPLTRFGLFVVLEGIDGVGKTTQAKLLKEALSNNGFSSFVTAEPSQGPYGKKIRERSPSEKSDIEAELQLFIQDRRWHLDHEVEPEILRGQIVIQDRYYFSSMAYQGSLIRSPEEIRQMHSPFAIKPDLVFYLDMEPSLALSRIKASRQTISKYENLGFLEKVRSVYLSYAHEFHQIDANQPAEEITKTMLHEILKKL